MTRDARKIGLEALANAILSKRDTDELVVIYPHVRADGDAYGSSFALVGALKKLNIPVLVLLEETASVEGAGDIFAQDCIVWPEASKAQKLAVFEQQAMAIQVDSSEKSRLATRDEVYFSSPEQAVIDHHINSRANGGLFFIDRTAGANVELIYTLILLLEEKTGLDLMDHDIALVLYIGLLTDTGGLSYDNTGPETLVIASELIQYDLDVAGINNHLFKEKEWEIYQFEAELARKAKLSDGGDVAYLTVSQDFIHEHKAKDHYLEHMPATLRNIKGVKASLMLRETIGGDYRGNLRSTGDVDISLVANAFNGGGHKNASGFTIENPETDIDSKILEILEYMQDKLDLK